MRASDLKSRRGKDFELTGNIADMHLTTTARARIEDATKRIKTPADLEAYLRGKGIRLTTSSQALQNCWREEIDAVKRQMDWIIAAIEQYVEIGGLSAVKVIHIWDQDIPGQGQYVYRAKEEGPVEDEGHVYIGGITVNGFQVLHEFAHAYADSTKPADMDVLEWSAALNKRAGLAKDATAYFGADRDALEAERFADTLASALAYGAGEDVSFLVNVVNIIAG